MERGVLLATRNGLFALAASLGVVTFAYILAQASPALQTLQPEPSLALLAVVALAIGLACGLGSDELRECMRAAALVGFAAPAAGVILLGAASLLIDAVEQETLLIAWPAGWSGRLLLASMALSAGGAALAARIQVGRYRWEAARHGKGTPVQESLRNAHARAPDEDLWPAEGPLAARHAGRGKNARRVTCLACNKNVIQSEFGPCPSCGSPLPA